MLHQRARLGFWLFAVLGSLLVVAFSLLRGWQQGHGLFSLEAADALLVGAVVAASVGYIHGARITPALGAERVICWVCLMALPVSPARHAVAVAQPSRGALGLGVAFCMWACSRCGPASAPGTGGWPGRRPAREPDAAAAAFFPSWPPPCCWASRSTWSPWALPSPLSPPWWRASGFPDMATPPDTIAYNTYLEINDMTNWPWRAAPSA